MKQPRPAAPFRWAIEKLLLALIGFQLLVCWHVGWFEIEGGSMAPSLRGAHRPLSCADCKFPFACDAEGSAPSGKLAICPNCGHADQPLDALPVARGDRLIVHKAAFAFRPPRRWELVAVRSPDLASQVAIKRVVGLPGETISLSGGDVFVNGTIQRKSLAELRELAVLVHDDRYRPADSQDRWRGEAGRSRWRRSGRGYLLAPRENSPGAFVPDWLAYHHARPGPASAVAGREAPIVDGGGYNQTSPLRDLFEVTDVMLRGQIRATEPGGLMLYASDGRDEFIARLDARGGQAELSHNARVVAVAQGAPSLASEPVRLEFALVDRRLMVGLNGQTLLCYPFEPRAGDRGVGRPRIALAASSTGGLEVGDLQLFRDIYYRSTAEGQPVSQRGQYSLSPDEYYLLGDNSPFSQDSRAAGWRAGVRAKSLVGKPFLVYYPTALWTLGGWSFQVPELSRIRYIP